MRMTFLLTGSLVIAAGIAVAQGTDDKQKALEPGLVPLNPSPPPVDPTPKRVKVPGSPPSRQQDSAEAGALKGVQAVSIKEGEARLRLVDGERTVRPGDTIGGDVVKSIGPGQIVLLRGPAAAGPDALATVVVKFDDQGRARVRVYYMKEKAPVVAPEVK